MEETINITLKINKSEVINFENWLSVFYESSFSFGCSPSKNLSSSETPLCILEYIENKGC